jgi:polyhydroxyalkanoate synthesis regulator phasin
MTATMTTTTTTTTTLNQSLIKELIEGLGPITSQQAKDMLSSIVIQDGPPDVSTTVEVVKPLFPTMSAKTSRVSDLTIQVNELQNQKATLDKKLTDLSTELDIAVKAVTGRKAVTRTTTLQYPTISRKGGIAIRPTVYKPMVTIVEL